MRDTGIGIPPEEQARIFLEFEQADSGRGRKFSGTGLGLAISKRIIERMGGRIGVDSSLARGLDVPLRPCACRMRPMTRTAAFAAPDLDGAAVLIVAPAASKPRWWRGG